MTTSLSMPKMSDMEVPQVIIDDVRTYLSDMPMYNRIMDVNADTGEESSDSKISLALRKVVDRFNSMPPILDIKYNVISFPAQSLLLDGAIVELLRMQGILASRNKLTFQDSNFQVSLGDKAQEYMAWAQQLQTAFEQTMRDTKVAFNVMAGIAHLPSPLELSSWNRG